MVDAFSDYARAPEMNRTNLNLNVLIRQVADLYPAQQKQPAVLLSLAKDLPETGADAVRIRQVMHNLIRNALEAMEGQADAEVLVKTQLVTVSKGERILISVSDNGPGLPAADKEKIFEPYVTTKSKGTGLGLAIVKKLIDEHGGDIVIESEVGKGTTVEIYLPVVGVAPGNTPADGGDSNRRQRA
jgi:nitrogen fixation/metabolism regulation signal transduction histidine kinase